jgi:hypothetical protein
MRHASNETVLVTLDVTGPAHLDFAQPVYTHRGGGPANGPGKYSGNPSVQHRITYDQPNQNLTNHITAEKRKKGCPK